MACTILVLCFVLTTYGADFAALESEEHQHAPPKGTPARPMPRGNWSYDWSRFPAAWFGNNVSGFENEHQLEIFGKYSLIMFGWQAMQGPTNYSHTLRAQVEQARRVKERYPGMPTVVYVPGDGAQPLYDAELALFEDFERYSGFFYLNATGGPLKRDWKCAINTTHSGEPSGRRAMGCEMLHWNFYNASAKEYYLEVVLKEIAGMDPDNAAFDGIFIDAAMGFMRSDSCPKAAANCPANVTKAETDAIGTEILQRTVENLGKWGKWGKYPIFNAHYGDMSYNGDTRHSEEEIMASIGNGGMMRYYDGDAPLSIALIDNALRERQIQVPTVFHVKGKKQPTIDAIAAFLVIQQNYSYFMESNGYYDSAFKYHAAYDYDYGLPLSEPVRTVSQDHGTRIVSYTRIFGRCNVTVSCNATKCVERGKDLIHNCCDAEIRNSTTGLVVA
jgi:hypothetical protein